jgi:hypothetical protein
MSKQFAAGRTDSPCRSRHCLKHIAENCCELIEKGVYCDEKKKVLAKYKCLISNCSKPHTQVEKRTGFTNVKRHFFANHVNNSYEKLDRLVDRMVDATRSSGKISSHFAIVDKHDEAVFETLQCLVMKNRPLSDLECPEFKGISKFDRHLSTEHCKDVLREVCGIVENGVAEEMKTAGMGGLLHDGWTKAGNHFLGVFAACTRKLKLVLTLTKSMKRASTVDAKHAPKGYEVKVTLVSCSPLFNCNDEDTDDTPIEDGSEAVTGEATTFTAKAHVDHIKHVFSKYYNLDVQDWAKHILADNAPVNQKTARDLDIPSIGCKSHLLNLEANHMIARDDHLQNLLVDVRNNMTVWKNSNKNSSIMRELTPLRPSLPSKVRWSGNCQMLEKWLKTRLALIDASDHENATIDVDATQGTKMKLKVVERHAR